MIKYIAFSLLLITSPSLFSKTLVFTTGFNRPDFIELQHRLFEKFLEDDYEFLVVSDANTPEMQKGIQDTCKKIGIQCYDVPQEIHTQHYLSRSPGEGCDQNTPNVRHCTSVQWAWDNYFSIHDGPVMVIDSDMFLIRPFSIEKSLENTHLIAPIWGTSCNNEHYHYLWLGLILFNNPLLPERHSINFNCGKIPNSNFICDSGGWTGLYLRKFKDILKVTSLKFTTGNLFYCPYRYAANPEDNFSHLSNDEISKDLKKKGFTEDEIQLVLKKPNTIELLGENQFLHYRAGTNYEKYSNQFILSKDTILLDFFETILAK